MSLSLTITGDREAAAALRSQGAALRKPVGPLLQQTGEAWAAQFQRDVRTGPPPETTWPELHPITQKIRRHYGHGAKGPRLIRQARTLHDSITVLEIGSNHVEVGTTVPHAGVLQTGGTWTDDAGTREVQAFPFITLHQELLEDTLDALELYFFEASDG